MTTAGEVLELCARLRRHQEIKGYKFAADKDLVFQLLEGLLVNKERYGYMSCPCRLASGNRAADRDIICPCEYREADVREYGTCYCGLYVSGTADAPHFSNLPVPERRPANRTLG